MSNLADKILECLVTGLLADPVALRAPHPLLIETGNQDPLNGAPGLGIVFEQAAITQQAYELHDADDCLDHDVRPGEHQWYGVAATPWHVDRLTHYSPIEV